MDAAVVFLLDPGLSGAVEQVERELELALEHGHEPTLDDAPERLLLAVLLGALGESPVLKDRESLDALHRFCGEHGGPVVAQDGAGQATLLERLTETMHQRLGVFWIEVPLRVAAEPGVIVQNAEQNGLLSLAAGEHDGPSSLVEVEVPEGVHVGHLERPSLTRHEAFLELVATRSTALGQAVVLHVAAN